METLQLILIIAGALIAFVLFWVFIVWIIAQIAGWPTLAQAYPARQPHDPACWGMQSALLRGWSQYRGVIRICADQQGLHFSTMFPFSLSNQPFSVPWAEISGRKKTRWLYYGVDLQFERTPNLPVSIRRRLADQLAEASGGVWGYEE